MRGILYGRLTYTWPERDSRARISEKASSGATLTTYLEYGIGTIIPTRCNRLLAHVDLIYWVFQVICSPIRNDCNVTDSITSTP